MKKNRASYIAVLKAQEVLKVIILGFSLYFFTYKILIVSIFKKTYFS